MKTWSSTQASIAQSSGEAEYYALVRAASEALGMQSIMRDLGCSCKIRLLVDSSAAKSIASRTGLGKLRHLEIKFLWLQECVRRGKLVLSKVRGDINLADVFTKPKSLEDMKLVLIFSCINWCEGESASSSYSSSCEVINSVGRYNAVHNPTVRRRGVLEFELFVSGPTPRSKMFASVNIGSLGDMLDTLKLVGFGISGIERQIRECVFGSRCMWW